jgi:hypothetical protein
MDTNLQIFKAQGIKTYKKSCALHQSFKNQSYCDEFC